MRLYNAIRRSLVVGDDFKFTTYYQGLDAVPSACKVYWDGGSSSGQAADSIGAGSSVFTIAAATTGAWKADHAYSYKVVATVSSKTKTVETGWFIPRSGTIATV